MKFIIISCRLVFIYFFLLGLIGVNAQKIKVACVGNSVTHGFGIEKREQNSFPAQLQDLLGAGYEVGNFGHSGATMLKKGHKPYWDKPEFKKSQNFSPNIVIIHLGLNDQGLNNWPKHKDNFVSDYLEMISIYKNLPTQPKVFICRMTPTFSGHHWFEEGMRENFKEIQTKIEEIAGKANVSLIDLHEPLYKFPELFPDDLHPNRKGATIIAKKVYYSITGDHGGLQLPILYGEQMVFQRNEPIVISGIANANDELTIIFNKQKNAIKVPSDGAWKILLPSMQAGGPYKLLIQSKLSEDILIDETYIGEVWLASGQSNMDFKILDSKHASTILKDSLNKNVYLFSLDPKVLKAGKFNEDELAICNAKDYFRSSGWTNSNQDIIENFSAVAYSYAYNLQKKLKVPVGIVCNAVGGAPTQSFISRSAMENEHTTIDLLNDTWLNPMVDTWPANRIVENIKDKNIIGSRHPYDATFLFDSGIRPLKNFRFKGVIWYQGESNSEQIELHTRLFKMLVNDWRSFFGKPNMPFYFVQLSSLKRPGWGAFRDSQRRLLTISNTGMAVSSDVGNLTDVHPKRKWVIGKRLSNIALNQTYKKNVPYSGPLFDFLNVMDSTLEIHFKFSEGLATIDGNVVSDLKIAGEDLVFVDAESKIIDSVLKVWSQQIKSPRYVKYGFNPFTTGNLINSNNLPASSFSNLIKK